jgi:paraquat-inducible protein A
MGDDEEAMTTTPPAHERSILAFQFGAMGVVIPAMLITALTLNIIALTVPFLMIDVFAKPHEAYSIPATVSLMWSFKFYWIAILIAVFSICFPFVKITSLLLLWYLPLGARVRSRGLRLLSQLGRWSLLDVFVALVLIVLSHHQTLIVTSTEIGLPLFLAAICLSILTGEIIAMLQIRVEGKPPIVNNEPIRLASGSGWRRYAVPVLLLGALASVVAAIGIPYVKITAWYLSKNEYSIFETMLALGSDGKILFASIVALFLVILPVVRIGAIGYLWYGRMSPDRFRQADERTRAIGAWAMIDVFGLALVLFLTEGSSVIPIERAPGFWAVFVAIALNFVLGITAFHVIKWRLAYISGQLKGPPTP